MYQKNSDEIYVSSTGSVDHRDHEYPESGFKALLAMQSKHFWYIGRHTYLLKVLKKWVIKDIFSVIDLGGGCGGWIFYLKHSIPDRLEKVALADSSRVALISAKKNGPKIDMYQVDLMSLEWQEEWDVAFLLDVIEHCPDDIAIIEQAAHALKPGGYLILTAPALEFFWSYSDVHANHLRRYSKKQFREIAKRTGLNPKEVSYFMFFLSPILWLSRSFMRKNMNDEDIAHSIERETKIPPPVLNWILTKIFQLEAPIGQLINFPWGTSILGVFEKPK